MPLSPYFLALALTIAVELPLVGALAPRGERVQVARVALLLNLFTHPLANLAHWEGLAPLLLIELAVILAEALGYSLLSPWSFRRSLLIASVANVFTGALGMLFA